MKYNIIIDAGNTKTKIYKGEGNTLELLASYESENYDSIAQLIARERFENGIFCNVGSAKPPYIDMLKNRSSVFIDFDSTVATPLKNGYETPNTLGVDRLAAAVGANELFPGADILVIDAGTAITIDLVCGGVFIGGAISPGMRLRFDSLHRQTKRLPLLEATGQYSYPGRNTHDSIVSGVIEGIVNEIDGTIFSYRKEYSALKVVLTGGDADIFAEKIKNSIFAEPKLLAQGLNRILKYNVEKI